MRQLVILGAGGHAREMADVAVACQDSGASVSVAGYLDDNRALHGRVLNGFPVLGGLDWLQEHRRVEVISGVGSPATRRKLVLAARELGARFATLVHPHAVLTRSVELGEGTVITAGCVLTNSIRIGAHVCLNRNTTVGHDCVLEDFVNVSPGVNISGNVTVREAADIGTGVSIIQGLEIGAAAVVGAGAVVIRSVPPGVTAVGVPARVLRAKG